MIRQKERTYLPSCWNDDVRMNALFSVFRKKDLNPTGWQDKMDFWINVIILYCQEMKQAVVTSEDIRMAFEKNKRFPACIDDVFDHMHKEGFTSAFDDFGRSKNEGWINWGFNSFVKYPMWWGYSTLKGMFFEQQKDSRFIMNDIVEELVRDVLQKHKELLQEEKVDNIVEFDVFKSHCKNICAANSFDLVLARLGRDGHLVVITEGKKKFIKFKCDVINSPVSSPASDKAVIKLRTSLQAISNEIDSVEKEIDVCTNVAKQCLREGSKTKAMASLRKRKRLEAEMKRKTTAMENLETMMGQLKNTASEKQVLDAYNAGVVAMKSCFANDLDMKKVDSTMADLEDIADDIKELESVLSRGLNPSYSENDDDLEQELAGILGQESKESEEDDETLMRRLHALRSPISTDPSPTAYPSQSSRTAVYRNRTKEIIH